MLSSIVRSMTARTLPAGSIAGVRAAGVAFAAILLLVPSLPAGPVPGVDHPPESAVDFQTPASVEVRALSDSEFEVTFRWRPMEGLTDPGIAGDFNNWSRDANPMTGPDEEGFYRVTLTIAEGVYEYKFVGGDDGWFNDPLNPELSGAGGYGNTILRLGLFARIAEIEEGQRGDGEIAEEALLHDQRRFTYFDSWTDRNVLVRFRTLRNDVERVRIELLREGESVDTRTMEFAAADDSFDFYEIPLYLPEAKGADAYRFVVVDGDTVLAYDREFELDLSIARTFHTPEWARDAIWYQIMIDRFRDGDPSNNPEHLIGTGRVEHTAPWTSDVYEILPWEGDPDDNLFLVDGSGTGTPDMYERLYGGDFQGVIDKLDYLADLGVNAIYFNPIFEATSAHKYNARSFVHADDGYGVPGEFARSMEESDLLDPETWTFNESDKLFLKLVEEARARDFRIIIDGVWNHLGADAVPFLDVVEHGEESRFADWYDIVSWEPFEYRGWAGFAGLPQFAKSSEHGLAAESLREHIFAVTRRWMDPRGDGDLMRGVDGWRLDVPMDVPMPFWYKWRDVVKETNPDAYLVGEVWSPAEEWLDGRSFDAVMNYQWRNAVLRFFGNVELRTTPGEFDRELARLRLRYPRAANYVMQNLLDSHDTDRIASRLMNPDLEDRYYDGFNRIQDTGPDYNIERPTPEAYHRLKMIAVHQATYVGAPMIYYGTEVGMYGPDDPFNRNPMWWEDLMPYDDPDNQIDWSIYETFQDLFRIRAQHKALRRGEYRTVHADDDAATFGYLRYLPEGGDGVLVLFNNSDEERTAVVEHPGEEYLPAGFSNATLLFTSGDDPARFDPERSGRGSLGVTMPPATGTVILVRTGEEAG